MVTAKHAPTATALVLEDYGRLVRRELPLPAIGTGDALLQVEACGMCGTDHEVFTGKMRWPLEFIPGHETIGIIAEIGPLAARRWGVAAGDRVAVANRRACRTCERCQAGELPRCERYGPMRSYGMMQLLEPPGLWGGYATHHYLHPDSVVYKVPDSVDPLTATVFNPLAGGFSWAVEAPQTKAGDVVAVLGAGMRGICAVAAAKASGARFVLITGCGERDKQRLETALRFGADLALDVAMSDPVSRLREAANGLADVVVDVTANAPAAFGQAVELAATGGRVVVAGIRGDGVRAECEPDLIVSRELRLCGVRGISVTATRNALRLLGRGETPFQTLPRIVAGFDTVADLLRLMAGRGDEPPPVHAVFSPAQAP